MKPFATLGFFVAWFVLGQARMVLTSRMVEYRIDDPDPSQAMAFTRVAAVARRNAANYNAQGRHLLPWYLTVTRCYWLVVAVICCWAIYHA